MTSKLTKIVNELNGARTETGSKRATQQRNRVLDQATRNRRTRQQLAHLEQDNFHDDPHANLVMHKKAPKFDDSITNQGNGSASKRSTSHARIRMLPLHAMIEEDMRLNPQTNYTKAAAPSPDFVQVLREPLPVSFKPLFRSTEKDSNQSEQTISSKSQHSESLKSEDFSDDENSMSDSSDPGPPEKRKKRIDRNESNAQLHSDKLSKRTILTLHRRHFCCVCGFQAAYTCIVCGMRYCCVSCLQTHKDTRCLKWTV